MLSPAGVQVGQGTWGWGVSMGSVCWEARGSVHAGYQLQEPPLGSQRQGVCVTETLGMSEDVGWGVTPHLGGSSEQHSFLT